jgi:hypothetical protein
MHFQKLLSQKNEGEGQKRAKNVSLLRCSPLWLWKCWRWDAITKQGSLSSCCWLAPLSVYRSPLERRCLDVVGRYQSVSHYLLLLALLSPVDATRFTTAGLSTLHTYTSSPLMHFQRFLCEKSRYQSSSCVVSNGISSILTLLLQKHKSSLHYRYY